MERQEFIDNVARLRVQMLNQALHYLKDEDDAEDIVQEALTKLWMMRKRIDDATRMTHLASVVVKNTSISLLRSKRPVEPLNVIVQPSSNDDAQRQMEEIEQQQRLQQAILQLSDKQRAIIRMRNVENLSYSDIARIMGTTESSVRGMISKARAQMIKQMKGATK